MVTGEEVKGHFNKSKQSCTDLKIPVIAAETTCWKRNCHSCTMPLKLEKF